MLEEMPRGGHAARPSPRVACSLEPRPRQALGILTPYTTVRHHNRDPLSPRLAPIFRHFQGRRLLTCCHRTRCNAQHPRRPGGADVFLAPIRHGLQHGDALPPQRALTGELAPLLLAGGINVEGEDKLADRTHPVPPPAVHAEDRDDAGHACSKERERIKNTLAHPQRA